MERSKAGHVNEINVPDRIFFPLKGKECDIESGYVVLMLNYNAVGLFGS